MRWALYDLSCNPPSFDVFSFLQYCHRERIEGIWLKPGYNNHVIYGGHEFEDERVKTIVIPAIEMHGLKWKLGGDPEDYIWPRRGEERYSHRMNWIHETKEWAPRFIPPEAFEKAQERFKGRSRILVILRRAKYQGMRNSRPAWEQWAQERNAVILPDFHDEQMPLAERLACYELSDLNFGVNSGNMAPNYFSSRPYLSICWERDSYWAKKHDQRMGYQFPRATKKQKCVWNMTDTYEDIDKAFQDYMRDS